MDENTPNLPSFETAESLPKAGLRRYAPNSGQYGTYRTRCSNRVHRFQEFMDSLQVAVGG